AEAATDPVARIVRTVAATLGPIALPIVLRRRRLLAAGVRTLGHLRVRYRHSPLSHDGPHRPRNLPRAGDRLPAAHVTTAGGPGRLHDLTARPGIHVLLQRDATIPDANGLHRTFHVHRLTNETGTGVLAVRPDGYVGFVGDHRDWPSLADWLRLVC